MKSVSENCLPGCINIGRLLYFMLTTEKTDKLLVLNKIRIMICHLQQLHPRDIEC